ncbi:abortive infection family protein [Marinobacter sp.]|uniref:abortive infection family protein n=1 Tax=Marinobacter sp. TaxID=50741 RepID=UPI003BAB698C
MQAIPRATVDKFSRAFAGTRVGFSAKQITDYFTRYSPLVKPHDHYAMNPTRVQLFVESVYALTPEQQYYSLNDLTFFDYESKYEYPSEEMRTRLRGELHSYISLNPIGLGFSEIRETEFRKDWLTAHGRLLTNPPAAVTAARTLLETLFKTIVSERDKEPDGSGNLGRLLKQAEEAVGFVRAENQAEHQLLQGLVSTIDGVSSISNNAGDRHGTVAGVNLDDPHLAYLCVNACGTAGLCFIKKHLFEPMPQQA